MRACNDLICQPMALEYDVKGKIDNQLYSSYTEHTKKYTRFFHTEKKNYKQFSLMFYCKRTKEMLSNLLES